MLLTMPTRISEAMSICESQRHHEPFPPDSTPDVMLYPTSGFQGPALLTQVTQA